MDHSCVAQFYKKQVQIVQNLLQWKRSKNKRILRIAIQNHNHISSLLGKTKVILFLLQVIFCIQKKKS